MECAVWPCVSAQRPVFVWEIDTRTVTFWLETGKDLFRFSLAISSSYPDPDLSNQNEGNN